MRNTVAFVGIELPFELQYFFQGVTERLGSPLRMPRSRAHITLKAPHYVEQIEQIYDLLEPITNNTDPIKIALDQVRFFDEKYLIIEALSEKLHDLHQEIAGVLAPFNAGASEARSYEFAHYHPHATIAVTAEPLSGTRCDQILDLVRSMRYGIKPAEFSATAVSIFELDERTGIYHTAAMLSLRE